MRVVFAAQFKRSFKRLSPHLQEEALEKIELFKNPKKHRVLKVHKLEGPLKGRHSFSVNYKFRIVFEYLSKTEVVLLAIGDHAVYDE